MLQICLPLSLINLIGGCSFLLCLFLFRKFAPEKNISVMEIVIAYVLVNAVMLGAAFLRLIGTERNVMPYRLLHAFSLGYTSYALLSYLFRRAPAFRFMSVGVGLAAAYCIFLYGPYGSIHGSIPPKVVKGGIEFFIIVLSVHCSALLFAERSKIASIPWRRLQTAIGVMLIVLPIVEFLDYGRCNMFTDDPRPRNDGIVFMVSAVFANIALLFGLFGSLAGATGQAKHGIPLVAGKVYGLSPRETEICGQLLRGMTNREIGEALFISTRTVDAHMRKIFQKCGASSRLELIHLMEGFISVQKSAV